MADVGYRWQDGHPQRRKAWAAEIARQGGVQCGCVGTCARHRGRCQVVIYPGMKWDLGHRVAIVQGGDVQDARPWCRHCNRADGANLSRRPKVKASRDW